MTETGEVYEFLAAFKILGWTPEVYEVTWQI